MNGNEKPEGRGQRAEGSPPSSDLRPQLEFPSLDFPGRTTLYPHECALRIGCHVDHIYDLVDEGILKGVDISGGNNLTDRRCIRIPIEAWRKFVQDRTT